MERNRRRVGIDRVGDLEQDVGLDDLRARRERHGKAHEQRRLAVPFAPEREERGKRAGHGAVAATNERDVRGKRDDAPNLRRGRADLGATCIEAASVRREAAPRDALPLGLRAGRPCAVATAHPRADDARRRGPCREHDEGRATGARGEEALRSGGVVVVHERVMVAPLLAVRDLVTSFRTDRGALRAVDGVSFEVPEGATVGIVGESGCGKSVTALSILRLIPSPPGAIEGGAIEFRGNDLLKLSERAMRDIRGNEISMIFQEPMTSLNPVYTVGWQIVEAIRLHQKKSRREARARAIEMLRLVGIPSPETNVDSYPHQLSGGQRQRVMIAMALACEPSLLIADEPTTALDVTIQAQILELLRKLQSELGMSVLLITHDLGLIAEYTEHVLVMYAGRVVESAPVADLFRSPHHPYTRGLLGSLPRPGFAPGGGKRRLVTIEGVVPDLRALPPGCRFADRCPMVIDACRAKEPELEVAGSGRLARCIRWEEVSPR